jgi:pyruvate/2-oxoglutarate dehydrogenase complex dihydrolipoamide dehydrogenase (E3) component
MYDLLVLGGGPAGTTAALRARELGASVALVERDRMGGTCTNAGCVPTRVLAARPLVAQMWRRRTSSSWRDPTALPIARWKIGEAPW